MTVTKQTKHSKNPPVIINNKGKQKLSPIKKELLECYKSRQHVLLYGNDPADCRRELTKEVWLAGGGVDQEEQYFLEVVSLPPKNLTSKEELENKFKKDWIDKYSTIDSRSSEGYSYVKELSEYIEHRSHITDKTWRRIDCGSWNGEQAHNELIRNISNIHHHDRYNANIVRSKGIVMPNGYLFLCRGLVFLDNLHCNSGDAEDSNHYRKIATVIHDRKWGSHTYDDTGIPLQGGCTEQTKFDWLVVYTPDHKTFPPYFKDQFKLVSLDDEEAGVEDNASPNLADNIFCYKGGRWEIAFDGKTIFPTDKEGFRYISYVLSKPKNNLHNYRIYQSVKDLETGLVTEGQKFDAELYPESSTKIKTTKEDKGKDYQNYKNIIDDLDKEDEELKKEKLELKTDNRDMPRVEEIDEQLIQNSETRKLIAEDFKSGGKIKSENEKTAYNVYMNIYRSLQIIEKEHPILRNHLKAFFTNGKEFTFYSPDRDIPWQTNRS